METVSSEPPDAPVTVKVSEGGLVPRVGIYLVILMTKSQEAADGEG